MQRISASIPLLVLSVFVVGASPQGTSGQGEPDETIKKARLRALYTAYQAHEVTHSKPAKTVEQLSLAKDDVKEFKRWLNLDELGLSLAGADRAELAKSVMAFEKTAPTDGGLVMFYDGSVRSLSAAEVKKLVGKN